MVEKLHEELGLNRREANELVEAFFEEMRAALERGDSVKLAGFGKYATRDKHARGEIPRRAMKSPSRRGES